MVDPLAEVVSMLQPRAPFSKLVSASTPWAVQRTETGRPFYFAVLEGRCNLTLYATGNQDTIEIGKGDFVLIPAARGFATSSVDRQPPRQDEVVTTQITAVPGGARIGDPDGVVDLRMLVGNCVFDSPDAALLVSLLPQWVHVRGEPRLSALVQMVGEESRADRPARDIVMAHLLEVLLIEALRSSAGTSASRGLMKGLADAKISAALRCIHESPAKPWTVAQLAEKAALSRSSFFERFAISIGVAPMEYLMAWRMALAKRLLRQRHLPIADIAERVGYSSVSTFGVAFTRQVGMPPGRYAKSEVVSESEPAIG